MFLVKLLQPVRWQSDGRTARALTHRAVRVRVCAHPTNAGHPDCGEEFVANGKDLVAVQFGPGHN